MKYSTVLVAAFASQALARAVPGDALTGSANPVTAEALGANDKSASSASSSSSNSNSNSNDYDNTNKYDNGKSSNNNYDSGKPAKSSYDSSSSSDNSAYQKWQSTYYAPATQSTYDQKKSQPDYKPYSPQPPSYDESKSCYDNVKWPVNVKKEQPCPVQWQPKHGSDYKPEDDCKIYLYHTKDYSKPKSTVCEDCGKGSYDKWTPPTDCESSDDSGYMYRFKFVKKDDESSCTWGAEFPIYGDKYDDKKESVCPPPAPVPDCPSTPPTAPPAKAPEQPSYSAPAAAPSAEAPAAAPEASYPAAAAPATPDTSAAAPVAPAPAAAPAAAAPTYPTAEAPTQGVANETVPAVTAGGAAIKSSVSVIFTVAALVTFLL